MTPIRAAHIPQTTAGGDCIEGYPDGFTSGGGSRGSIVPLKDGNARH